MVFSGYILCSGGANALQNLQPSVVKIQLVKISPLHTVKGFAYWDDLTEYLCILRDENRKKSEKSEKSEKYVISNWCEDKMANIEDCWFDILPSLFPRGFQESPLGLPLFLSRLAYR